MNEHPIQGMAESILENINQMVDVNTIVGEPIITPSGVTIIPISKVSVGFGLGGGDFKPSTPEERKCIPFGGGGGGALTITPIAFLTVSGENVKLITIDRNETTVDKALPWPPKWWTRWQTRCRRCSKRIRTRQRADIRGARCPLALQKAKKGLRLP